MNEDPIFLLLLGSYAVCLLWEMAWPRRPERAGLPRRWTNNFGLTVIGQVLAHLLQTITLLAAASMARAGGSGVLEAYEAGWLAALLVTALCFEFVGYAVHVAMHEVPFLWRFHAVHHSDTDLDVLSTYRHHPGEQIFVSLFSVPIALALAPPASVLLAVQAARMVVNIFSHANVQVPEPIERILRRLLVTPDFHRLHHASEMRYTNSNYGATVPWFDYLFGTASHRPFAEQKTMELGLEYFREPADSRLDRLLLMPFRSFPTSTAETAALESPRRAGEAGPRAKRSADHAGYAHAAD